MPLSQDTSFYCRSVTASADGQFQIDDQGIVLTSINLHCYGNDAYYGNLSSQAGVIRANSVVWFDAPCRVSDFWFKNYTSGSNCQIVVTGTIAGKV